MRARMLRALSSAEEETFDGAYKLDFPAPPVVASAPLDPRCILALPLLQMVLRWVRDPMALRWLGQVSRFLWHAVEPLWENAFVHRAMEMPAASASHVWRCPLGRDKTWKVRYYMARPVPDLDTACANARDGDCIVVTPSVQLLGPRSWMTVSTRISIEGAGYSNDFARTLRQSSAARSLDAVALPNDAGNVVIRSLRNGVCWEADGGEIKNLSIVFEGSPKHFNPALLVQDRARVHLSNVDVSSNRHAAVFVERGAAVSATGTYFHGSGGHGCFVAVGASLQLDRCVVANCAYSGLELSSASLHAVDTIIAGNGHNGIGCGSVTFDEPDADEMDMQFNALFDDDDGDGDDGDGDADGGDGEAGEGAGVVVDADNNDVNDINDEDDADYVHVHVGGDVVVPGDEDGDVDMGDANGEGDAEGLGVMRFAQALMAAVNNNNHHGDEGEGELATSPPPGAALNGNSSTPLCRLERCRVWQNGCNGIDVAASNFVLDMSGCEIARNALAAVSVSTEAAVNAVRGAGANVLLENGSGEFVVRSEPDDSALQRLATEGGCTVTVCGTHYVMQPVFTCETCNLVENLYCCAGCVVHHRAAGHVVQEHGRISSFCDCYFLKGVTVCPHHVKRKPAPQ